MADDIWSALSQTYRDSAADEVNTQKNSITFGYQEWFENDLQNIEKLASDAGKAFNKIAEEEANLNQLSLKYRRDIAKQESQHYVNIYNLKNDLYKKEAALLEQERDIKEKIANQNGKVSKQQLAQLYTLEREQEKNYKKSFEYQQEQFNKFVDSIKQGWANIVTHVVNDANRYLDLMIFDNLKKGITDLQSQYESRYTEIAARSGSSTKLDVHNIIKSTVNDIVNNSILKSGLNFNNEVFPAITDAVQKGFIGQKIEDIAISNAIDKKIMPWLDTSSETWVDIQYNLSDNFITQIKGQQMLLQATQEGNRILQNGVVSELTSNLLPTLYAIDANTTTAESMGASYEIVEQLTAQNWDKTTAVKFVRDLINADQKPFDALTSNDTFRVLAGLGSYTNGGVGGALQTIQSTIGNILSQQTDSIAIGAIDKHLFNGILPANYSNYADDIANIHLTGKYNNKQNGMDSYNLRLSALNNHVTATQSQDNLIQNKAANTVMDWNLISHGLDIQSMILDEVINIKNWLIKLLITTPLINFGNNIIDNAIGKFGSFSSFKHASPGSLTKMIKINGAMSGGLAAAAGAGIGIAQTYNETSQNKNMLLSNYSDVIKNTNAYANFQQSVNENSNAQRTGAWIGGGVGVAGGIGAGALIGSVVPVVGNVVGAIVGGAIGYASSKIGAEIAAINRPFENVISNAATESLNNITLLNTNWDAEIQSRKNLVNSMNAASDDETKRQLLLNAGFDSNKVSMAKTSTELDNLAKTAVTTAESLGKLSGDAANVGIDMNAGAGQNVMNSLSKQLDNSNMGSRKQAKNTLLDIVKRADIQDSQLESQIINEINKNWGPFRKDNVNKILTMILGSGGASDQGLINITSKYGIDYDTADMTLLNQLTLALVNRDEETVKSTIKLMKADIVTTSDGKQETAWDMFKSSSYIDNYKQNFKDMNLDINQFRLGSSYIPYDMVAQLHMGERVLTATQNREYTEELISGNSAISIIQTGVQDIITAIKLQTTDIINYLSTLNFGNAKFNNLDMSLSPSMGNTKVTI